MSVPTEKPEELVMHARAVLRKKFLEADIGITGCNFAIADTGSVSLVTGEPDTYDWNVILSEGDKRGIKRLQTINVLNKKAGNPLPIV